MRRNPREPIRGCSATASTMERCWRLCGRQRARGALEDNDQRFFGRGNQDGVRSSAIKTVGAPIRPLAVRVDHRFALWKDPCWPSDRQAVGPTPDGRTRPSEAVADRGYSRNDERTEQSAPERKFCRGFKGIIEKGGTLLLSLARRGPRLNRKGNLAKGRCENRFPWKAPTATGELLNSTNILILLLLGIYLIEYID